MSCTPPPCVSGGAAGIRARCQVVLVRSGPLPRYQSCSEFRDEVDEIVRAVIPQPCYAVGLWYQEFMQTSNAEVHELLERAAVEERTERS